MNSMEIRGHVAPGFEPVRDAFLKNFEDGRELGAGFAVLIDDATVVDIHAGWADKRKTRPWSAETLVPVYSTTKGVAAIVLARIIDRQVGLEYETPVAEVWPEFAANGKAKVTIGELVSHQAGLPGFVAPVDPELWLDPAACAEALAALAPLWPPGRAHGYHPLSWGYLVGELAFRLTGRTLGAILRDDICAPSGIDFHIGLPASEHDRCAEIKRPTALPDLGEINTAKTAAFLTKWASAKRGGPVWREIEIPSANGHGTALSVARLYEAYAQQGWIAGERVLSKEGFFALRRRRTVGQDLVLPFVTEFAAGVMRNNIGLYGPNSETLGHSGWGGSMALGDPDRGLAAAYVMNRQSNHLQGDPRARALVEALYGCL